MEENIIDNIKQEPSIEIVSYLPSNSEDAGNNEKDGDLFQCQYCNISFEYQCDFILHQVKHKKEDHQQKAEQRELKVFESEELQTEKKCLKNTEEFVCEFCLKPMGSKLKLALHTGMHHRNAMLFRCNFKRCSFTTPHRNLYIKHKHMSFLVCSMCPDTFTNKYQLHEHLKQIHDTRVSEPLPWKKVDKIKRLSGEARAARALAWKEVEHLSFKDPKNSANAQSEETVADDSDKHLEESTPVEEEPQTKLKCLFCRSFRGYKDDLDDHIEKIHKNATYACHLCNYTSNSYNGFYAHISAHICPYSCLVCDESFPSLSQVAKHHKMDHKREKTRCKQCHLNMQFVGNGSKPHLAMYSCLKCKEQFAVPKWKLRKRLLDKELMKAQTRRNEK